MRKILYKTLIILMCLSLTDIYALTVMADRLIEEQRIEVHNENSVSTSTNNTSISGLDSKLGGEGGEGGEGGSGGGQGGQGSSSGSNSSPSGTVVNVVQNVEVEVGAHLEISAYLTESIQGLQKSTYVPSLESVQNLKDTETQYSSIKEYRNFGSENKKPTLFTQDEKGTYSLDYIEALNWLYKNNLIHNYEDIHFVFQEKNKDEKPDEVIADNNASGDVKEHKFDLELPMGSYYVDYDMYSLEDKQKVVDESGNVLADTGGFVSGQGKLRFKVNKKQTVSIITNEGDGREGTYWTYKVKLDEDDYISKNVTEVKIEERGQKEEFYYPKEKGSDSEDSLINRTMKKKDFVMSLMKIVDGVEESRPLMFQSRYELFDFSTGKRTEVGGYMPILETPFKDQIDKLGIDIALNETDIDFNKYAMAKYYVNPNVYELYLQKAFNSGIISYGELADEKLKSVIKQEYLMRYKSCSNDIDTTPWDGSEKGKANSPKSEYIQLLEKNPDLEDLDKQVVLDIIDEMTKQGFPVESYSVSFVLDEAGVPQVTITIDSNLVGNDEKEGENGSNEEAPEIKLCNNFKDKELEEEVKEEVAYDASLDSLTDMVAFNGMVAVKDTADSSKSSDKEGEEDKVKRSKRIYDYSVTKKFGTEIPAWSNMLNPVKINYSRDMDNDGEFLVNHNLGIFGSSWSDPTKGLNEPSSSKQTLSANFIYNKDYKYFVNEELSYIDAVLQAYKAINAYADEKLPQREVDTIMSMYSVNYGSLTENEISALNYLIAKGIIDGDNAAKFTSTQPISVEDAIVLVYRIANPSARLTFKTTFGDVDEIMLSNGYAQSKTTLAKFEGALPDLEVQSPVPSEYFIIMNKFLTENNYMLSQAKHVKELDATIKETTEIYTSKQLAKMGIKIDKGTYTVKKYELPWDVNIQQLGFMTTSNKENIPAWIEVPLGGGFYVIEEESLESGKDKLTFTQVIPDFSGMESSTKPSESSQSSETTESTAKSDEEPGFFSSMVDRFASLFGGGDDDKPANADDVDNNPVNSTVDTNGNIRVKENNDIVDDNDPLGILDASMPLLKSLYLEQYEDEGESSKKVYIAVNNSAKANLLFDGHQLFKGGEINTEIVTSVKDVDSINILESMPTDQNGKALFSDPDKTFLEFVFPSTNRRSINELKSLVQRRLTLTGESEIKDEDISSYTGTVNGQTLVSRKELSMFGVTATKDQPDILYHAATGTYAYLNVEDSYALISNTVVKFPANSVMIEINSDEIYYNVEVVMSMMNTKDYYLFNGEGKYQIVSSLYGIEVEAILNPATGAHVDNAFIADIDSYISETNKTLTDKGKYLNISSVSNTPATFFMAMNEQQKKRRIYGFEPYYVKSSPSESNSPISIDQVTDQLTKRNADILFIENVLINNSLVRQEFFVPKSETFLYVDNAIKVTDITEEKSYSVYAEKYLEFIENLYKNISVSDARSEALIFRDANSYYTNSKFELEDLLNRANFKKGNSDEVKKLIDLAKKGDKTDVNSFWVLYFLGKFTLEMPYEENVSSTEALDKFKEALIQQFNKKYKFSNGFSLSNKDHVNLLDMNYVTETDITDKRRYEIKRIYPVNLGSYMTTDEEIYININRAVYLKLISKLGSEVSYAPPTEITPHILTGTTSDGLQLKSLEMSKYMNNGNTSTLSTEELNFFKYQRDILGNSFYVENGKLYNPQITYYTSLPQGRKPLRNLPKGSIFSINTSDGAQKMIVLDNAYLDTNGDLMVKVAKVNLTKFESSYNNTTEDKLVQYYKDEEVYKKSLDTIGEFVKAVNRNANPIDRILKPTDLSTGPSRVYFNYSDKKKGVTYKLLTSSSSSAIRPFLRDFILMEKNTNATDIDPNSQTARLSYYDYINAPDFLRDSSNQNLLPSMTTSTEALVYETFLFNYGTVSVDPEGYAHLDIRSDNILNTSPVVTDLVNQLVKKIVREGVDTDSKRVGDLVSGDKLMISDGSLTPESLMLVKTDTKEYKGHSHFISSSPMGNTVTPSFMNNSNALLISNSELFDSVKIWAGGQRLPLYNFIGNRELNLAKPNDIVKYKNSISLVNVYGDNKILVETKNGNSIETKKLVYTGSANGTTFTTSEVKPLTEEEKEEPFSYIISLYLDSNLLVKLDSNGYYVIDEYGDDNLVNASAFTSRASRFEGVMNSLLTVLPTYSAVDGKFLGFDLTALELKTLKDLFKTEWWSNFFSNVIMNAEIILSALGFYYVYALMVLAVLARSMTGFLQNWVNKLLKFLTLGRLDVENMKLRKFLFKSMIVLVLLTFTYSGAIRDIILFTEEIRIAFMETFVYPFTE